MVLIGLTGRLFTYWYSLGMKNYRKLRYISDLSVVLNGKYCSTLSIKPTAKKAFIECRLLIEVGKSFRQELKVMMTFCTPV